MRLRSVLLAATVMTVPLAAKAQPIDGLYIGAGVGYNYKQDQKLNGFQPTGGFFGLTGTALFIFRRREVTKSGDDFVRVPGHPYTTGLFVLSCWSLVLSTLVASPLNAGIGVMILAIGALVYLFWVRGRE